MVFDRNIELKEKQQKLLAELRKIVGRGFECSEAYLKQCNWECNRIGKGGRQFGKITKKYVYVSCRAIYTTNEENTEYGAEILKYSVCTTQGNTNKIELEDLFVCDLEKILKDVKFALWWETERMKKIEAEKAECQKYVDLYNKFVKE
jgi:hypothetical protein